MLYAPEPLVKRDIYQVFKRHTQDNGYNKDGRIVELLKEIAQYARYYAAIAFAQETNVQLKLRFDRIAKLELSVVNPLLLSLYADYEAGAFTHDDFLTMLDAFESYLFRRAICDCSSNAYNKFMSTLIGRLNKVQDEGGDYCEAFIAFLLNEAGTSRRFPTDVEFEERLRTRDCYNFRKSFYLLSRLENSAHSKNPIDFANGSYTIEHIMPRNAPAHAEWTRMLGENWQEDYERCVNNLGNLTLTVYNSELSDASFQEKKERVVGGYENEYLTLSKELISASEWNAEAIDARASRLVAIAKDLWKRPELDASVCAQYVLERKVGRSKKASFKDLFNAGLFKPGDVLVGAHTSYDVQAVVTNEGKLRLANGTECSSPSLAFIRAAALLGRNYVSRNGWAHFRLGENGPIIDELRKEYLAGEESSWRDDPALLRISYWDGFFDYCASLSDFVAAFGDMSERTGRSEVWAFLKLGSSAIHLEPYVLARDSKIGVQLVCDSAETYQGLLDAQANIDELLGDIDGNVAWDALDENKKTRAITISKHVNFDSDDWQEMYATIVSWIWKLKAAVEIAAQLITQS